MIPKIIHYCWFGGNPKPKLAKKCIKSWKKHCKGYEIIEWNESNIDFSIFPKYVHEAYKAKKWGFVPDYIRLWIIYNYGGIYLDTDVEVLKPFDDLLNNKAFAGFEIPTNFVALGLGFGAEPGNNIIKELMDSYNGLNFLNSDGSLNLTPAPKNNSEVFRRLGVIENNTTQVLDNMVIYSSEYFCPKTLYSQKKYQTTSNTYSVHHFMASWLPSDELEQIRKWKVEEKHYKRRLQIDRIIHFPNRITKKIFGDSFYSKIKRIIKK